MVASPAFDREQMIIQHLPYVRMIAGRIAAGLPPSIQLDDLYSEGYLGLMSAVDAYVEGVGKDFKAYAFSRIWGTIWDWVRKNGTMLRQSRGNGRQRTLKEFTAIYEEECLHPPITAATIDPATQVSRRDFFEWALAQLPSNEAEIMALYYGPDDLNYRDIGDLQKPPRTDSSICQAHGRAINRLRDAISAGNGRVL